MRPYLFAVRALVFGLLLALVPAGLGQGMPQLVSASTFRAEPGALITLNGFNFLNPQVTAVYFNFTPGSIESIRNIGGGQQQIAVRVPVGATIGPLIIENGFGQYQSTRYFQVPPVVTRFQRAGATTDADRVRGVAGNLVEISGANFLDATDSGYRLGIFFDGVRAVLYTVTETSVSAYVPAGAGTGSITVTNNAGAAVTPGFFHIPPGVTGFTPRGRVGDSLSITGRSFRAVSSIAFGTAVTTNFTVLSPTNLTVVVPSNAPASGPLAVESPGGRFLTSSNFVLQPRILSFTPTRGDRGTNVIITGTGLAGVQQVQFGGVPAVPSAVGATRVTVTVPLGAGTGPITVVSASGQDVSTDLFYLAPQITALGATRVRAGESLTITGTNFLGATDVQFGPGRVAAASFVVDSNRQITAVVPTNAATGRVWVRTPGGEDQSSALLTVSGPAPLITGFSPASGAVGSVVTVSGTNLSPALSVRIGGVAATSVQVVAGGLAVTVPTGAASGRIVVETAAGTAASLTDFLVGSSAALSAQISVTANPVVVGTEFRLTLRVLNAGPLPASGVRASLGLPVPTQFRGTTPSAGTFSQSAGAIDYTIGTIAPGSSWTAQVRLQLTESADVLYPLVATNSVPDFNLADNAASIRVQAVPLRLEFSGFGDQLVLSWPSSVTNVVLQETPRLASPEWRDAGLAPLDDGVRLQVTVGVTNLSRLFRLIGP